MAKATKKAEVQKPAAKNESKPLTKNEIIAEIAEQTKLPKKDVSAVLDALAEEIKKSLGKKGAGSFALLGLLKIEKKRIPAKPAKKNVLNRFTGVTGDVPAKPAHDRVKIRALKALKDVTG